MSVLEGGNLQLHVKNKVYHLRKLGKLASSKIYFFTKNAFFYQVQSYSFFKIRDKHDLHEIAMN